VSEIQPVVDTFFAAFTSGPGLDERMAALRAVLRDDARITKAVGGVVETMDVDAFVEPRRELLASGRLEGFREWETYGETRVFGAIAQHWCTYSKTWTEAGVRHEGRGSKSLQLVREDGTWRISAAAWDDE
jgi:hypothetical protein